MQRVLDLSLKGLFAAAGAIILSQTAKPACAFGGEDPINGNPWHHEMISKDGAQAETMGASKWTPEAAASIAWHADYVDSYLYNPLWWAKSVPDSGIKRFKASRSVQTELEALHFDDLFGADKVSAAWRRYASGTFAGLMWAEKRGDVGAAQNILGASLHAIQDFYSHSNWLDDPARRNISFFEMPKDKRASTALFTGAYEHQAHMGVKPHGKYLYAAALFKRPGVAQVMEAACSAFSPLAGESICEDFKASKSGVSVRPTIDTKLFGNVKVPKDVLVLAPPGIALDNTWIAEVGVKERGLKDLTGEQAFQNARALAVKQTTQWLQTMEKAMKKAGAGEFWDKVRTQGSDDPTRFAQFEQFNRFPFLFLAAGPYPPVSGAEEWYLRIKLTTGTDGGAGTDSDIKLRVAGEPDRVLDWMPKANPILAHNDFENGDDEVYIAGPYSSPPGEIELYNDSANAGDVAGATLNALKNAAETAVKGVVGIFKGILGTNADHIATNHKVWMPEELMQIPTQAQAPGNSIKVLGKTITLPAGKEFSLDFNGYGEGTYRAHCHILKTGENESEYSFQIRVTSLECLVESKWDRGSNSDEPFLVGAVSPMPGDTIPFLSKVFDDVDKGETVSVNTLFRPVTIPKGSGMLNLALGLFEHDDESQKTREELRDKFVGKIDEETEDEKRGLVKTLGAAVAADWKLARIEVDAWSRNGRVKVGNMLEADANVWIKGKQGKKFTLSMANVRDTNVTTDELLPYLPPSSTGSDGTPTQSPTPDATPDSSNGDTTSAADLDKWTGVWTTPKGELTVVRDGDVLRGQIRRVDPMSRVMGKAETMELRAVGDGLSVEGTWAWGSSNGPIKLTWKENLAGGDHPGMEEFSGTYVIKARPEIAGAQDSEPSDWNGWRTKKATTGNGSSTQSGTPPVGNNTNGNNGSGGNNNGNGAPNGNPGTVPPLSGTGAGSSAGFQPLDQFQVRVDETKIGLDGKTLEVIATFRNITTREAAIGAGNISLVASDEDGIGFKAIGNLYRASGDVPERLTTNPVLAKNGEVKIRFVFDVPTGIAPLKTLTFRSYNESLATFSLSNVKWPKAVPAFSASGLKNGGSGFQPFNDQFDVRFDGFKRARDKAYEAFVTFKNMEKYQIQNPWIYDARLFDADGIGTKAVGNLYRANGGDPAERIQHSVSVEPNGEAHLRIRFVTQTPPVKFTLKDLYGDTTLGWAVTP